MTGAYPATFGERHLQSAVSDPDTGGRSAFARDRDRILYSSAFRALGGKTQVVAATELGYMHNRLTHSLKVAQVGLRLASRLRSDGAAVDPDLVEAACLAHDIGHPPFGHAGETQAVFSELIHVREKRRHVLVRVLAVLFRRRRLHAFLLHVGRQRVAREGVRA
ncbi:MAG: HD domain-containing protein [Thermoanaerobaculia bacterium]